jgi:hypothetical protein
MFDQHEFACWNTPSDPVPVEPDIDPFWRADARVGNLIIAEHGPYSVCRQTEMGRKSGTRAEAHLAILRHKTGFANNVPNL